MCTLCFFVFKQKTAYELRISDWSSDVCSSDLRSSFSALQKRTVLRQAQHERLLVEVTIYCTSASAPSGRALEDRRDALAAADTHGFKAVAAVPADQFARQIGQDAAAGRTDRVAERDARPVDVEDFVPAVVLRPAPALEHREHLRREGFVEFDEVDIVPAQPAAREQPLDGGDGADAHAAGVAAGRGERRTVGEAGVRT